MSLNATMGGLTGEVSDVSKLIFDGEITVDDIIWSRRCGKD